MSDNLPDITSTEHYTPKANASALESSPGESSVTSTHEEVRIIPPPQNNLTNVEAKDIEYSPYSSELELGEIMELMQDNLSEPYSIYTYRFFINNWPELCIKARHEGQLVGAIVCQLEQMHIEDVTAGKGYIAMLAVRNEFRMQKIGSTLVSKAIGKMIELGCEEVILEAEVTNKGALKLYSNKGFVKDRYLHRYYLNAVDAWRLKLYLKSAYKD